MTIGVQGFGGARAPFFVNSLSERMTLTTRFRLRNEILFESIEGRRHSGTETRVRSKGDDSHETH